MCLMLVAFRQIKRYPLLILFNRDELYNRPSQELHLWENKQIFAPRDLLKGGTWLGMNRAGNWGGVTTFRTGLPFKKNARSLGLLVKDYLENSDEPEKFIHDHVLSNTNNYNPFNFICGNLNTMYWYSSQHKKYEIVTPGIHALSNAYLNTPWPKVKKAKYKLTENLRSDSEPDLEHLLSIMKDRTLAQDFELPNTGIDFAREKRISSIHVANPLDGTCSTSLLAVDTNNYVRFIEIKYQNSLDFGMKTEFDFNISTINNYDRHMRLT